MTDPPPDDLHALGRRRVIAIAIRWARGEPRPHHPADVRLAQDADIYGLPGLCAGDSEAMWVQRVRMALKQEQRG